MRNSIALGLKLERIRIDEVIFDITNLSCRDVIKNKSNVNPFIFHLKPFKKNKVDFIHCGKNNIIKYKSTCKNKCVGKIL